MTLGLLMLVGDVRWVAREVASDEPHPSEENRRADERGHS